ncbi:hypothetical protein Golob_013079 [Gossypium lobatum]|uniref:Myb/SANT-like domain-containing protein n=1 Tax=Gossypium lobatum TaxID=34289 RepID=A0A7J8LNQ9_9ROSI|nr:hypothetical protein [Gossypium lobatum]
MLKAGPNLESRIKTLKKDWAIINNMLSGKDNSSFGWDEHRQLVVAKDAVWNSHRSFPYYDQLTTIYVKDRTTGKDTQIVANIVEEIDAEAIATANIPKERNNYHGCEANVSLD